MSDFPRNRMRMRSAGFTRKGSGACRDCHAAIEWWKTPKGKMMPIDAPGPNATPLDQVRKHFNTCPERYKDTQ